MSSIFKVEGTLKAVLDKGIAVFIVVIISIGILYAGRLAISKLIRKYKKNSDNHQIETLLGIMKSVWGYLVLFFSSIAMLNVFGMGITATSLVAAAGAGGIILGIGAQDFVKDIVNGFTIILEGHFAVGDRVRINDNFGTVSNMTLRTTQMIGEKHETFLIPNSEISTVINYSKGNPRVFCYVYITNQNDVHKAMDIISQMIPSFECDHASSSLRLMGVVGMFPYGVKIGVNCDGKIGHITDLKYLIYNKIALELTKAGINFTGEKTIVGIEDDDNGA